MINKYKGKLELMNQAGLSNVSTKDLVSELKTRHGVNVQYADPYEDETVTVNGPATILVVID